MNSNRKAKQLIQGVLKKAITTLFHNTKDVWSVEFEAYNRIPAMQLSG